MLKSKFGFARASTLRALPTSQLLLAATLLMGIGMLGHILHKEPVNGMSAAVMSASQALDSAGRATAGTGPARALAATGNALAGALAPRAENVTREAELDDGQTFASLLTDAGATEADAAAAMNALNKAYDLRKLRAGQNVTLSFTRTDRQEILTGAVFQPEATEEVVIARGANGFTAGLKSIPVVHQRFAAEAQIRSSLYEAGDNAGVPHAVMASLIRVYSHDVDFQRDIHPGDRFEILYDQAMTSQGRAVGEGSIIYADLHIGGKDKPVWRVTFSDNTVDYFDAKGQSIRRALLRTPVAAAHITSGFGMRIHPLLGYSKMHKGVDFGATTGTPIFAAGNGTVEDIGFRNGYGRYIRLRHNNTLGTAYAHMSRFNPNLFRGAHVSQGQVIGYVGMSGRATGPHLHFEVLVNGQQVNPMSVNLPTGRTLDGKLLAQFKAGQAHIRSEFTELLAKNASPQASMIRASATSVAFPIKTTTGCGLRGGC